MPKSSKREHSVRLRQRGRILTPNGLSRIQQAIRAWELEHEVRCTQEQIKELTSAVKEGGLDPSTTRKILKVKEGVDQESIRCLFTTFDLQLSEADLVSSSWFSLQSDPNFVGREGAIGDLNTLINRGARVIVIQARGGVGKTTLARKYLQQEFGSYLEIPIAKETKDIASIESLIEEKLRQLGEEPGREFFVSLDRLKCKLQSDRIGILIDNLEPSLDAAGKFIEPHRRYVELLRVLADPVVQSVTLITSRERLNEYSTTTNHYLLRELSLTAWEQFFQNRFSLEDKAFGNEDNSALYALHKAYGGNAKAMDILCSAILADYDGKVETYWQDNQDDLLIERALEDLVIGQFDRLQQTDPDSYNLLCRMGCYRYQDVPTVPLKGLLCLLWDVPENRQRRVVKSLQERSLVEFENGEYCLHPVIREEAIRRCRVNDNWLTTNQKAAEFWKNRIQAVETIEDALESLEAYYHYLAIDEYDKAASVISQERPNQWDRGEHLGRSFYRLGLYRQIINAVNQIVELIQPGYNQALFYNILGDTYWRQGDIHKAIEYHEQSKEISNEYKIKNLSLAALLNVGICKTDLLEIEEAREWLGETITYSKEIDFWRPALVAEIYLAFIDCYLSSNICQVTIHSLNEVFKKFIKALNSDSLTAQQRGYGRFFLGLSYKSVGNTDLAFEILEECVIFAEKSNFIQAKAKVLYGLAELYREKESFQVAISHNLASIDLLEHVGAKCDLAEAYYQLGLTYQAISDSEQAAISFQKAIRLFSEMGAPKQIERVKRLMITNINS